MQPAICVCGLWLSRPQSLSWDSCPRSTHQTRLTSAAMGWPLCLILSRDGYSLRNKYEPTSVRTLPRRLPTTYCGLWVDFGRIGRLILANDTVSSEFWPNATPLQYFRSSCELALVTVCNAAPVSSRSGVLDHLCARLCWPHIETFQVQKTLMTRSAWV